MHQHFLEIPIFGDEFETKQISFRISKKGLVATREVTRITKKEQRQRIEDGSIADLSDRLSANATPPPPPLPPRQSFFRVNEMNLFPLAMILHRERGEIIDSAFASFLEFRISGRNIK